MTIHNSNNTQKWRQKWELIIDNVHSGEFFHTWHHTEDEAYNFITQYVRGFGTKTPTKHYRPYGMPHQHSNVNEEPFGTFIKHGAITLAPI